MSNLFKISDEERERIKFLHETNNPHAVIIEQRSVGQKIADYWTGKEQAGYNSNRPANTKGDYGIFDKVDNALGVKYNKIARDKERLNNIANMKKQAAANKGMVTVGGKPMRWTDYIATYNIQPDEIKAAENINVASNAASKNQQDRYKNIVNIQNTVDANGIIQNKASSYNGKTWSEYISQYKITPDEIKKANDYAASLGKQSAAPVTPSKGAGNTQVKGGIRQSGVPKQSDNDLQKRFQTAQSSLGIKGGTGKMDLGTLQSILAQLNGGSTGGGEQKTPSIDQLNASLAQLTKQ